MADALPATSEDSTPTRVRWSSLFQHATQPLFVLNRHRRIRFVNPAWEQLTGRLRAEVWGRACATSGPTEPLFRTLAPTPEAIAGDVSKVRRPVPSHKNGPPWWDITFVPLQGVNGTNGYLATIHVVATEVGQPSRKVSASTAQIREKHAARFAFGCFPGTTPATERFQSQLRHAASCSVPVWIVGEPGTGKETAARTIHYQSSHRERAFIAVDCGGVQPYLFDAVLFGLGGLFPSKTIGTIYLKNPGLLPRDLQQKIADAVREPYLVRLVCSSAKSAADDVQSGTVLPIFQTQLATLELQMIPLRKRLDDLPRLLDKVKIAPEAWPVLQSYDWPGNIRELESIVGIAAERAGDSVVTPTDLPRFLREKAMIAAHPMPPAPTTKTLDEVLEAVETRMIEAAMRKANGNQTEAAAALGILRTRLGRRLEALKIATGPTQ